MPTTRILASSEEAIRNKKQLRVAKGGFVRKQACDDALPSRLRFVRARVALFVI